MAKTPGLLTCPVCGGAALDPAGLCVKCKYPVAQGAPRRRKLSTADTAMFAAGFPLLIVAMGILYAAWGGVFDPQLNRFDRWARHLIPVWAEFVLAAATCIVAVAVSVLPMKKLTYIAGYFAVFIMLLFCMPALDKLPGAWNDIFWLLVLACMGLMTALGRLRLSPGAARDG